MIVSKRAPMAPAEGTGGSAGGRLPGVAEAGLQVGVDVVLAEPVGLADPGGAAGRRP